MPRSPRVTDGGIIYHVLNRANGRMRLFDGAADYELMLAVLGEAHARVAMRTLGYCIMPNHWHLVLWPRGDGDLSEFMRWLTVTHTQRWHASHGTAGAGHVYQGRYKSFPVQRTRPSAEARRQGMLEGGDAVLSVLRYVERNPLRAKLARRAEGWATSSPTPTTLPTGTTRSSTAATASTARPACTTSASACTTPPSAGGRRGTYWVTSMR